MFLNEKNLLKNIIEFKNDIMKKMNSLENKLDDKLRLYKGDIFIKLDALSEKIIPLETDVSTLIKISSEKDKKLEKIDYLEKYKSKTESDILSQNIRINKIFDDIENIRTKYDKIFIEHLTIPGFVGYSCKYKTISEYIVHNIKESEKDDKEKDEVKNDVVTLKQRVDNLHKLYFGIFDTIYERSNNLVDNKIEDVKIFFQKKIEEIWDKISEMKLKDIETRMNIDQYSKEFKLFTEDIYLFKDKVDKIYINTFEQLDKTLKEKELKKDNDIDKNEEKNRNKNKNKKDNKNEEEKEMISEKTNTKLIDDIKDLKEEIRKIKKITESEQNENRINITNAINKFNLELIQLRKHFNEINSKIKTATNFKKLNDQQKLLNEINSLKELQKMNINKLKEIEKNNSSNNLINVDNEKNIRKDNIENDIMNNTDGEDLNNNKLLLNKSRNNIKLISTKKYDGNIKELFLTRTKKNKINEKQKINRKVNFAFFPNIKKDKYVQSGLLSSRNKSYIDYLNSKFFNSSLNDINSNKRKKQREMLSPVVDKMYKEYFIKKHMKEKSKENEDKLKKQTVEKIVPAFGRTNYESF